LESSFRGRKLVGAKLSLPAGYRGLVVQRRQGDSESEEGVPAWAVSASFSELSYWNHDTVPLKSDGIRRCLEWASLAGAIHAPVAPASP
jgi:hypothetical protein